VCCDCLTLLCAQVGEKALAHQLLLNGDHLDPAPPLTLILHKPVGYVVTSPEDEVVLDPKIYDLLPFRYAAEAWKAEGPGLLMVACG
jgi:16S rRNA U516 pseudouridylate synthase RsuA-like enzyme